MLILEELCWNCQNRDYVPQKDKYGKSLSCPHCKDGTIITSEGQAILDFVERHLVDKAVENHERNYKHNPYNE